MQAWRARRLRRPCGRQPLPKTCTLALPPQVWRLNPTSFSAATARLDGRCIQGLSLDFPHKTLNSWRSAMAGLRVRPFYS